MCSRTHRLVVNKGNLEVAVEAEPSNLAVWPPEQFVRAPGVFLEQPEAKKTCFKTELPLSAGHFSKVTSSYSCMVHSVLFLQSRSV